jgi:ketosteroid isomerase-like protein
MDKIAIAKASYQAYVDKDRAAIEALLAPDFHFSSPLDNRLDRDGYFRICWPNSGQVTGFDYVRAIADGSQVVVTYEASAGGRRFRNTEVMTIRDDRIVEVEVYFGWSVPHAVPIGEHRDP